MTETQTAESTEPPPAVPCNNAQATGTAPRRLKRPGNSTADDAGEKRPRTAPVTPIDIGSNGPGSSHAVPDLDVDRAQDTGPPDNPARPSAAASAPAALTSEQHSQPAVSTGAAAAQGHGADGHLAWHHLARQQPAGAPADSPAQLHPSPLPAGSVARTAISRGGTPHSETHSHADPHHRHDALEEQVFSPAFHNHAAATPASAAGAGAGEHSPGAVKRSVSAPLTGVPVRSSHPHGPSCTQLHAIDLNVVEGVAADEEEEATEAAVGAGRGRDTAREQGGAAAEEGDVAAAGAAGGEEGAAELQMRRAARGRDSSTSSGDDLRAVGERLSSSDEGAGEAEADEGDEEETLDANDENAPVAAHQQHHPRTQRGHVAASGQQRDVVLVASAPRNIAVSGAAAAAAAQPDSDEAGGDEEELFLEFDPLLFIKQLPPLESCVPPNRPPLLPPQEPVGGGVKRKTLVLDLDETLVHSSLEPVARADFSFPVSFNGAEHMVHVRQRPHLRDFMVRVAGLYEVVVFTASQRIYAERLLDILDPGHALVRHRIYRDSCVVVDGNYLKDLSVLGRELAHTIIVDNSPQAFGFQVDNGIPIESWYDDDSDDELLRLLPFLESLAAPGVPDVRPHIRQQFKLQELIDRA